MQILPIRQILVSGHIGIISIVPLGILLISPVVGNDKSETKEENDHDLLISLISADERKAYFGNSRNHAHDDTCRIGRRFCEHVNRSLELGTTDSPDSMKAYGPTMLPTATPTKMTALAITFLVVPPTFPVTSDNARLNTALEAPVKSAYQLRKEGETYSIQST